MATFKMLYYLVLLLAIFSICPESDARHYSRIYLPPGVTGPETIAFDCLGRGPYVGVSDGRILRWEGAPSYAWSEFATMPNWSPTCSHGSSETTCGRPLGLKFHPQTCELYVADSYHGLVVVGSEGGRGVSVSTVAEGIPFMFTNALDIDPQSGVVYFTDSSMQYPRWNFNTIFATGDSTGRLMSYNPYDRTTRVLLRGIKFANGVALSQNMDFVLVSETTTGQIHRFWLKGPRAYTSDIFISLRGRPDNINRGPDGNFWIAQVMRPDGSSGNGGMPVKVNEQGRILERLDAASGELVTSASDVKEYLGRVWIGSVLNNYVEVA